MSRSLPFLAGTAATTNVAYHTDGFSRPHRPAINVKCYGTDRIAFDRLASSIGERKAEELTQAAWEQLAEEFWTLAEEESDSLGLGPIESEGRSGGWLVFTDGRDPEDGLPCVNHRYDGWNDRCVACVARQRAWLRRYRTMQTWVADYIADVPAECARIAAEIATDMAVAP
jgi:hypothetical protein